MARDGLFHLYGHSGGKRGPRPILFFSFFSPVVAPPPAQAVHPRQWVQRDAEAGSAAPAGGDKIAPDTTVKSHIPRRLEQTPLPHTGERAEGTVNLCHPSVLNVTVLGRNTTQLQLYPSAFSSLPPGALQYFEWGRSSTQPHGYQSCSGCFVCAGEWGAWLF